MQSKKLTSYWILFIKNIWKLFKLNSNVRLNKNEMICPRCLGKGFVDLNDIKRLDRKKDWCQEYWGCCDTQGFVERGKTKLINPRRTDIGPEFH